MGDSTREIIKLANERGYFPTRRQAGEIIDLSCWKLFRVAGPNGRRELTDDLWEKCDGEAIEEVMEGKWSQDAEDKKLREEFFNSDEGRAFVDGKIAPWEPGETTLARARRLGCWPTEELIQEIEFAASSRSWSRITKSQSDALLDWAIIACVEREIQYLTRK